jgi:tRNA(fMet)-specific endonuclease VapC
MTKILLDTNAYSGFMAGDQIIFDYIVESETVYLSTVMLGELFAGFRGGSRYSINIRELKSFLSKDGVKVINVTIETSEIFGEIKTSLSNLGKMIPLNDIWIAAHTIECGAKLITYDSHFKQIAGLRLWEELTIR